MIKKFILPLLVIACGIFLTVMMVKAKPEVEKTATVVKPPTVRTMTAQPSSVALEIGSQGTVVPETQANLVAEIGGTIRWTSPNFDEGGFFRQGQTLLKVDPRDYELAVASANVQLAQAKTALSREEAGAQVAGSEWKELGEGEANPLVLRVPQLAEATAQVEAAKASLAKAELDLERTEIKAPFTGRLRAKAVDLGEFVNRGTPLATIYSAGAVEVRLPVPDSDLAFLDLPLGSQLGNSGPKVTLMADFAGKLQRWEGRIVRTGGEIDPTSRMINLIARVNDAGRSSGGRPPLSVGLFVEASIEGRMAEEVFEIPRGALRGDDTLLVVDDTDKISQRTVKILRSNETSILVSQVLLSGDQVCLTNLETVIDGMTVTPEATPEINSEEASS